MSRQCTLKSLSDFILIKICNVFYSRRSNDICKSLHINTMYESQMRSPNKVNSCCSILVTNVNKESIPHFKKMAFRIFYDCVTRYTIHVMSMYYGNGTISDLFFSIWFVKGHFLKWNLANPLNTKIWRFLCCFFQHIFGFYGFAKLHFKNGL